MTTASGKIIGPETLKNARANGQICFCWYRIKIAIPPVGRRQVGVLPDNRR